jgi:hypothetical protein
MIQELKSAKNSDNIMTYDSAFHHHTLVLPPSGQCLEGKAWDSFVQNTMHNVLKSIRQQCWKEIERVFPFAE